MKLWQKYRTSEHFCNLITSASFSIYISSYRTEYRIMPLCNFWLKKKKLWQKINNEKPSHIMSVSICTSIIMYEMYSGGLHDIYSLSGSLQTAIGVFIIIMYFKYFGRINTFVCLSVCLSIHNFQWNTHRAPVQPAWQVHAPVTWSHEAPFLHWHVDVQPSP